jgi:hypothetical protein
MRPELPTAVAVDNSASIQPARSIFISWGKSVQISGATSEMSGYGKKIQLPTTIQFDVKFFIFFLLHISRELIDE